MATITLSAELQAFADAEALANGYADASEYLGMLIRREQKQQAKEHLQAMVMESMASGEPLELTDEVWADMRPRVSQTRRQQS